MFSRALDSSFRFSCAFYQVFSRLTAVSCFPLLARVGTEFMFSGSSHTFHVSRAWQRLQVFPRVSTNSPTLAADSCFPALIIGFIISAVLTSALVYYAAVICLVTQRRCSISHSTNRTYFVFLYFFKSGTHVSFDRLEKCFILATIQSPLSTRRVEASLYIVSKITSYKEKGSSSAWELIKWLARRKCCDLLKIIF